MGMGHATFYRRRGGEVRDLGHRRAGAVQEPCPGSSARDGMGRGKLVGLECVHGSLLKPSKLSTEIRQDTKNKSSVWAFPVSLMLSWPSMSRAVEYPVSFSRMMMKKDPLLEDFLTILGTLFATKSRGSDKLVRKPLGGTKSYGFPLEKVPHIFPQPQPWAHVNFSRGPCTTEAHQRRLSLGLAAAWSCPGD